MKRDDDILQIDVENGEEGPAIDPTLNDIATHLRYLRRDMNGVRRSLREGYVRQEEFRPVKTLVYSFTGLLLTGLAYWVGSTILKNAEHVAVGAALLNG